MELNILLDYDNIPGLEKRHGIRTLFEKIVSTLPLIVFDGVVRIRIRLYGGWFEEERMSRNALLIEAEIYRDFPFYFVVQKGGERILLSTSCELAKSMEAKRDKVLTHTYRPNYRADRIYCINPSEKGCTKDACSMKPIVDYFNTFECPDLSCKLDYDKLFIKNSQKLVDGMLMSDMMHHAFYGNKNYVIVSSDDDLIPGIGLSLISGAKVYHVHPYPKRKTPDHYNFGYNESYYQVSF